MRKILGLLLFTALCFANPWTYRLDTSSTNLASTFISPQLTGVSPNQSAAAVFGPAIGFKSLQVYNPTSGELEINCTRGDGYHPLSTTNNIDSFYVPAGVAWSTPETQPSMGRACYMRGRNGSISTGIITLTGWGQ